MLGKDLLLIMIYSYFLSCFLIAANFHKCYTIKTMADKAPTSQKAKQLTLEEYAKIKGKLTKSKLKLNFPWIIKVCFIIPLLYCVFLIIYYLVQLRFLAEH